MLPTLPNGSNGSNKKHIMANISEYERADQFADIPSSCCGAPIVSFDGNYHGKCNNCGDNCTPDYQHPDAIAGLISIHFKTRREFIEKFDELTGYGGHLNERDLSKMINGHVSITRGWASAFAMFFKSIGTHYAKVDLTPGISAIFDNCETRVWDENDQLKWITWADAVMAVRKWLGIK